MYVQYIATCAIKRCHIRFTFAILLLVILYIISAIQRLSNRPVFGTPVLMYTVIQYVRLRTALESAR